MINKSKPVATLTIRHPDGLLVTVEVSPDAGHNNFFRWYRRPAGSRRREFLRESYRAPGGLEIIAARCSPGKRTKITIRNKKLYRQLLSCATDQLPGYKPVISKVHFDDTRQPWQHGVVSAVYLDLRKQEVLS